jgi:hypothetical protein
MAKPAFEVQKLECDAFDNRVVRRHIDGGRIRNDDLQKHLAELPDDADQVLEIIVSIGDDPADLNLPGG